jgi:hypothetical protein
VKPFSLSVEYDALQFLHGRTRREQASLLSRFLHLRDYPENSTDVREIDRSGRLIRTSIHGKYAVSFWIDDADREVKVVEVRRWKAGP